MPPWLPVPGSLGLVAIEMWLLTCASPFASSWVGSPEFVSTLKLDNGDNSGKALVPPWLPGPEALALVASEPFVTLSEVDCNPGKSRLPPGLPEPGSLGPVASESLPTMLLELATARATELTTNCATELASSGGTGGIGVGWGVGVGFGVGPVGV